MNAAILYTNVLINKKDEIIQIEIQTGKMITPDTKDDKSDKR